MNDALMWMVRCGEEGYLFNEFLKRELVAIGWSDLGDLTPLTSQEQIRELYLSKHSGEHPSAVGNAVAMIFKFRSILKIGDHVVTYDPGAREYLVGLIKSHYEYWPNDNFHHVRKVNWLGRIERDALSASSRNSLGSTLTLFQLNEDTTSDVLTALRGDVVDQSAGLEEKAELEQLREDTVSRAHELIKDRILKLSDSELEELTATILRAMGYKSRVMPKGPDRGVDVLASPDGLGLEEPRIKAEVKHRPKTPMGAPDIRSFLGGLRHGDRALYVSTGGYSKDAAYEADRANVPITLLNLDDLASLVVNHYENFDMDGRVLIPLTRMYWPAE